jgi:hypothetical protein
MPAILESPVNAIPPTAEVRRRLNETIRESKLLRSMLRLAEARDKSEARSRSQSAEAPA